MDCQRKVEVWNVIEAVVAEEEGAFEEATTLLELEGVAVRMAAKIARRLEEAELKRRAEAAAAEEAVCPDCGTLCRHSQREQTSLESTQGELCYEQPKYYCRQCRRHFFPDGGGLGHLGPGHGHPGAGAEDRLGGDESE